MIERRQVSEAEALEQAALAHCVFPLVPMTEVHRYGPRIYVRGEGVRLWDADGREYLDMMSSHTRANSLGYGNREIASAVGEQLATLHYVDPPYMPESRSPSNKYDLKYRAYRHELTEADHAELLGALQQLEGMVVLSGYRTELYDSLLIDWERHETKAYADGARPRTECLWLNPAASAACRRPMQHQIFGAEAAQ